jgi:hypothetical protein
MRPLIRPGDRMWVAGGRGPYLRGQVLVFRHAVGTVAHRLVGYGEGGQGRYYLTKGDRALRLDPPLRPEAVLGRVVAIERAGKRLSLEGAGMRAAGWAAAVLGRAGAWSGRAGRLSILLAGLVLRAGQALTSRWEDR